MDCVAKYIGKTSKFGVNPGEIHEISLNTYETEHGSPYIWVKTLDRSSYLMPFVSVNAMLYAWQFIEDEYEGEREQDELEESWEEMYMVSGAVYCSGVV